MSACFPQGLPGGCSVPPPPGGAGQGGSQSRSEWGTLGWGSGVRGPGLRSLLPGPGARSGGREPGSLNSQWPLPVQAGQIARPRPLRSTMPTDVEPSVLAKTLHLVFLSTFWGMQIWVTFISGFVMGGNLPHHTLGFIQSRLFPYYFHIGSACAFFNLIIFAMCHPRELLNDEETTQLIVFFVCVIVSALNAQWFGQMTSDIMTDMHLLEQSYGLGQDIGLFSRKSYTQLRESNPKYQQLSGQLNRYRLLSSLCNVGCLACNGFSLYHMATHLSTL
ncbi:transmembrane protein 205-like isoform X2 [Sarcophilus harrisii]|nr:transmembrane protein 205-like isoform X2 [Sarcophilus harrisii]